MIRNTTYNYTVMDTNNGTESLSKALKYSYPATAPKMKITLTISSTVAIF